MLDQPNHRSSHSRPTPRGGGIVFVLLPVLASVCMSIMGVATHVPSFYLPLLAFPLAVVGFLDDRYNLPAAPRFVVHLITSSLFVFISSLSFSWFASLLLLIVATAVINFINFMDGIDGLVSGCISVTIFALSIAISAPVPIWVLLGSLIIFLFCNWSPAKVFMGDVGSTFLGAVFVGLVLQAPTYSDALGFLLVATPLLADACSCVYRRLLAGQKIFQAHRLHLFQRLHQAGWIHSHVSLLYIVATALLAVAMLSGGLVWVLSLAVVEFFVGLWLDQQFAVPFSSASKRS